MAKKKSQRRRLPDPEGKQEFGYIKEDNVDFGGNFGEAGDELIAELGDERVSPHDRRELKEAQKGLPDLEVDPSIQAELGEIEPDAPDEIVSDLPPEPDLNEDASGAAAPSEEKTQKRKKKQKKGSGSGSGAGSEKSKLGLLDIIGLALTAAIILALFFLMQNWMSVGDSEETIQTVIEDPDLPLAGKLFSVVQFESGWRDREETDRASGEEIIIPEAKIKFQSVGSGSGFIRVFFKDDNGRIVGDGLTVEMRGGKFIQTNRGEQILGDNEIMFTASAGFESHPLFTSYLSLRDKERWHIEISEVSQRTGDTTQWEVIAPIAVSNDYTNAE